MEKPPPPAEKSRTDFNNERTWRKRICALILAMRYRILERTGLRVSVIGGASGRRPGSADLSRMGVGQGEGIF
jgi:hypothetical protein